MLMACVGLARPMLVSLSSIIIWLRSPRRAASSGSFTVSLTTCLCV